MLFVITATSMERPHEEVGTTAILMSSHQIQEQRNMAGNALREVPGVEVTQSGSVGTQTDVSIQGSTAAQTLILDDSVAVNSGATCDFDLADCQ